MPGVMALLHDTSTRLSLEARFRGLEPQRKPRWGRMSADQMVWHLNQALAASLGQLDLPPEKSPLPRPLMKLVVLNLPWPKNAPTNPAFVPAGTYDFAAECRRCLGLIGQLASTPLDAPDSTHPLFGRMSIRDSSRLHARHLDHHLRQFGL